MYCIFKIIVYIVFFAPTITAAFANFLWGKSKRTKKVIIMTNTMVFAYLLKDSVVKSGLERMQDLNETAVNYVFWTGIILSVLFSLFFSIIGIYVSDYLRNLYKKTLTIPSDSQGKIS